MRTLFQTENAMTFTSQITIQCQVDGILLAQAFYRQGVTSISKQYKMSKRSYRKDASWSRFVTLIPAEHDYQ